MQKREYVKDKSKTTKKHKLLLHGQINQQHNMFH